MAEICRFLRVLEYVGTREALTLARERRTIKGTFTGGPNLKIFEGIIGDADQPIIGQLKIWCCQQIVAAADGELLPDEEIRRDGYIEAVQDILRVMLPESEYKALCEENLE